MERWKEGVEGGGGKGGNERVGGGIRDVVRKNSLYGRGTHRGESGLLKNGGS